MEKSELDKIYDELIICYAKQRTLFNYKIVDQMLEKHIDELEQRAKSLIYEGKDKDGQ